MTSRLYLTTRAYWAAARQLGERQSPADRAMLADTLAMISVTAPGRLGEAAALRLRRLATEGEPRCGEPDGGSAA